MTTRMVTLIFSLYMTSHTCTISNKRDSRDYMHALYIGQYPAILDACTSGQCVTVCREANRDQMKWETFLLLSVLFVPILSRELANVQHQSINE